MNFWAEVLHWGRLRRAWVSGLLFPTKLVGLLCCVGEETHLGPDGTRLALQFWLRSSSARNSHSNNPVLELQGWNAFFHSAASNSWNRVQQCEKSIQSLPLIGTELAKHSLLQKTWMWCLLSLLCCQKNYVWIHLIPLCSLLDFQVTNLTVDRSLET